MRPLPLVAPAGCTLSTEGLVAQLGRADRLAPNVLEVSRFESGVSIAFAVGVDHALVRELVATEASCCSFLELDYASESRVLRIGSGDPRGAEVIDMIEGAFGSR